MYGWTPEQFNATPAHDIHDFMVIRRARADARRAYMRQQEFLNGNRHMGLG